MIHHLNFLELLVLANRQSFVSAMPQSDNGSSIIRLISEAEKHLILCPECQEKLKEQNHYLTKGIGQKETH